MTDSGHREEPLDRFAKAIRMAENARRRAIELRRETRETMEYAKRLRALIEKTQFGVDD
jgi:hypothetical protein